MKTKICPQCNGTMYHSDDMVNPHAGDSNKNPFWQCEDCGKVLEIKIIKHKNHISESLARATLAHYKNHKMIVNKTHGSYMSADGLYVYFGGLPNDGTAHSIGYRKCRVCSKYMFYKI